MIRCALGFSVFCKVHLTNMKPPLGKVGEDK